MEACWLSQTKEGQTEQIHLQTFDDPFFWLHWHDLNALGSHWTDSQLGILCWGFKGVQEEVPLLCFDLLTRPKMPFKVVHRKEVTHPGRWKSEEVAQAFRRVYITAWEFEGNIRPTNWGQLEIARRRASSTVEDGGRRVVVGKASTQKSLLQCSVEQPWRTRKTQRWRP